MKVLFAQGRDFEKELIKIIKKRSPGELTGVEKRVKEIIEKVKEKGDEALIELTKELDGVFFNKEELEVRDEEIEKAYQSVEKDFLEALHKAYENILEFHEKQKQESWFYIKEGSKLGQRVLPLESVGVYVPGGKAAYPSTVLMNAIPAKVAGVEKIYMTSPPGKDKQISPYILAAAKVCGINKIFKIGGAQAVAAFAFGTQTIPKVDKIVGPGNIYVACAKKQVYGEVDVDLIAGPSEIVVIADETADERYVAYDLLSQAEHDENAMAVLITDSEHLAFGVLRCLKNFLEQNEGIYKNNITIAKKSIDEYGLIIIAENLKEAVKISNLIAPEHLEIIAKNSGELLNDVKNAGTVFLGKFSPEPIGDYIAGTNHVLPTNQTSRFFSPLGVYDFVKRINVVEYSMESFRLYADYAIKIAEREGLYLHANSLKVRMEDVQE
ncbi:histidinol dehydrogenase [Thermovenabulum sp.]|uniref:histidinol dehydrogenase n=1 Tax=Thermovenabulum sp. TaxID=3100335 RepID=UPI003C7D9A47